MGSNSKVSPSVIYSVMIDMVNTIPFVCVDDNTVHSYISSSAPVFAPIFSDSIECIVAFNRTPFISDKPGVVLRIHNCEFALH